MNEFNCDIYNLCSPTLKDALDSFCQAINSSKADIFIAMAHKASVLLKILKDLGHISEEAADKIAISNMALLFNKSYLTRKRIAIIDDIIISGTSISATVHKLLDIGINKHDISIIALATDIDYLAMSFELENGISALECNIALSDANCIEVSSEISKIFSFYGLPCNIEFPLYEISNICNDSLPKLLNNLTWNINEVTNTSHSRGNINVYTLFPKGYIINMLWKQIGVNLSNCAHIKLRLYIKSYPNGEKEYTIMPMCLFSRITEEDISKLFDILRSDKLFVTDHKAMLRYIQFYISHKFSHVVDMICECSVRPILFTDTIRTLFGYIDGRVIEETIDNDFGGVSHPFVLSTTDKVCDDMVLAYQNSSEYSRFIDKYSSYNNDTSVISNIDINYSVYSPFLWWYDNREIVVRNYLKSRKTNYSDAIAHIEYLCDRLNSGFSLDDLKKIVNHLDNDDAATQVISLFLDRAIDEGIVVPTISHNVQSKTLCRAYRHGEDLPFGLSDECRLLTFLMYLSDKIDSLSDKDYSLAKPIVGMSPIAMEKTIVLFYQMGLRIGNIFNRFLGFDNMKVLKPFLSVHGRVEGFVDPQQMKEWNIDKEHFYSESDDAGNEYITWLTKWLIKEGFLRKTDNDNYSVSYGMITKYLEKNKRNCSSEIINNKIASIAQMISVWYKANSATFKDDATALTSCADSCVYASAIATEVHYFSRFANKQMSAALENATNPNDLVEAIKKRGTEDEKHYTNTVQSLNSGREKVEWYRNGTAIKVIDDVAKLLNDNSVYGSWQEIWQSEKNKCSFSSENLELLTMQSIKYLYFYSACLDCSLSEMFWNDGTLPSEYNNYKEFYNSITAMPDEGLFNRLEEIAKLSFMEKVQKFKELIEEVVGESEDIVDSIEDIIAKKGNNYCVTYESALIFEINSFNRDNADELIFRLWNEMYEDKLKCQFNIVKFADHLTDSSSQTYGAFFGNSTPNAAISPEVKTDYLVEFYKQLCNEFADKCFKITSLVIPDIPPEKYFHHDLQRNIPRHTASFYGKLIGHLKDNFSQFSNQSLLMVATRQVPKSCFDVVEQIGWDNVKQCDGYRTLSKAVLFTNNCEPFSAKTMNVVTDSIVKVTCGSASGTGILIRTQYGLICITCNHIVCNSSNNNIVISLSSAYKRVFNMIPLTHITTSYQECNLLDASNEIVILKPDFKGIIDLDFHRFISLEELKTMAASDYNNNCICGGFPGGSSTMIWSDAFTISANLTNGYMQSKVPKTEIVVTQDGFSGGIIVEPSSSKIFGIHEGMNNKTQGRMIPINKIIEKIERYFNNERA